MSAICGLFQRDRSSLDRGRLYAAMEGLREFGHDGSEVWEGESIGFGMQILHITSESKKDLLPRYEANQRLALVANARIDNRLELSEIFDINRDAPDSEFLIAAYQKWGNECPVHLIGDFAFAIWDEERDHLFCARDYVGSRPFYYRESPDYFLFASDTEGIISAGGELEPDFEYLSAHFRNGCNYPHPTRTCYAGILALAPASAMVVTRDGIRSWQYWNPDELPEVRFDCEQDYIAALRELLGRSVSDRLRCVFPIGAHFSGGLDSCSIAVLAQRLLDREGQQLQGGYSWSPPPPEDQMKPLDERKRILDLAAKEKIPVEFSEVGAQDFFDFRFRSRDLKYTSDEPHEWAIRRHASKEGTRLLFSGWGGDEGIAFHGHGYIAELLASGRWQTLWGVFKTGRNTGRISARTFLQDCLIPLLPIWVLRIVSPDQLPAGFAKGSFIPKLLLPDFESRLLSATPLPDRRLRGQPGVKKFQRMLMESRHLTRRMEAWSAAGGRAGLEYAYPLLDRRIVEFALGIPSDMYYRHGWGRYLYRKAAEAWLPLETIWTGNKSEPALNEDRKSINDNPLYRPPDIHRKLSILPCQWQVLDSLAFNDAGPQAEQNGAIQKGNGAGFAIMLEWIYNPKFKTAGEKVWRKFAEENQFSKTEKNK